MKKQIGRELRFMRRYAVRICLPAIVTVFVGILVWVNGTMASWVYRSALLPSFAPGMSISFLLWVLVYALAGMGIGILLLPYFFHCADGLKYSMLNLLAYCVDLAWYPLFFSFWHTAMAGTLLICACILHGYLLYRLSSHLMISVPIIALSIIIEIYFAVVTIAFVVMN